MLLRCRIAFPAALAFSTIPAVAEAQSCYSLRSQDDALKRNAFDLASDNPGTALVVTGCVGMAMASYQDRSSESDAVGAFVTCAAVGCGVTDSYSNCISVGSQLIVLAIRGNAVEASMRQQGCGQ